MTLIGDSLTIAKREMLVFKSNLRTNIIRSLMFPFIIILFFGNLGSTVSSVPVAIVNLANNPQSMQFINSLQGQSVLEITAMTNQENALSLLQNGEVTAIITIEPTFPNNFNNNPSVSVYYSNSEFSTVSAVLPFIKSVSSTFGVNNVKQSLAAQSPIITSNPISGASSNYRDFIIASVIIMATAFGSIFGSGFSIIVDRQLGTIKSFLVAPINKDAILFGKLMAGTVQSLLYGFLALCLGFLFGAGIAMGPIGLLWILALIFFVSLSFNAIALIVASRIKTVELYAIVAQAITLPTWFLSGAFFPASSFPSFIQPFSIGDPLTYATSGIRDVMLSGYFPISHIITDFSIMIIFTVIIILFSFRLFKSTID
ncbi:MAG: ABC transporter permease [Candidatus Micrarchaeia archaeon]